MDELDHVWTAMVYRSGLDDRVWVPTIPGNPVGTSECMASTSLRRVKAYVEGQAPAVGTWVRTEDDSWEYPVEGWYERR